MVLCNPDWGTTGEHTYWRGLLEGMTVGRTELPNAPIYVPEDPKRPCTPVNGTVSCPS